MMVPELERPRVTEINVRIDCNGCVQKIKRALTGINGIYDFYLDIPQQKITVIGWADPERIIKAIKKVRKIATICSHNEASSDPNCPPQPAPPDGGCPPQDGGQQGMGMGMGNAPPPDPQSSNDPNYPPQQYENQPPSSQEPPNYQPQQCDNPPPPQDPQNSQPQQYENPSHQNPQQYENPSNQNPQQYENPSNQNPQPETNPPPQQEPPSYQTQQYANPSNQPQEGYVTHHPAAYSSREGYGYGYSYDPRYQHGPLYHPNYHEPPPHCVYHEPPPQPYVTHSYNRYKPSPYITEYQYVGAPPPPPPPPVPYTPYGRTDQYYVDSYQNGSTNNGNVTSMFSDENPNACTIV